MHILLTGGAGFVGSAVAAKLVADGHTVVVVDNFNQYYDPALKRDRAAYFLTNCTVVTADITDQTALAQLFTDHSFDLVCHLAAQAGVRYSVEAPEVYLESNIVGTHNLLQCMQRHGVDRMVMASTSAVYGTDTPAPYQETAAADHPVSVYAATKRAAELMAYTYYQQYGIATTCLRFFTVYGPWSRPDMAMLTFAQQMMAKQPIAVYNHGKLRRDFTYIDDIVTGFTLAVEQPLGYEVVNLGNGQPVALLDFIAELETVLGVTARQHLAPMQPGDVYETYADTSKAKDLLGYAPTTHFKEGVCAFADWYRSYYGGGG